MDKNQREERRRQEDIAPVSYTHLIGQGDAPDALGGHLVRVDVLPEGQGCQDADLPAGVVSVYVGGGVPLRVTVLLCLLQRLLEVEARLDHPGKDIVCLLYTSALRIIALSFFFAGTSIIFCSAFQSLGRSRWSLLVALLRQILLLLPAAALLLALKPALVWAAFPLSELISCFAAALLYRRTIQKQLL